MRKIYILLFSILFFVNLSYAQIEPSTSTGSVTTYPSSATEGFYINAGDETVMINMFSLGGKLVLTKTVKGTEYIDVNSLAKGTYIVKLTQNGKTVTKKLVLK
ncbi:MAG: T9SS type A sorting domain-containing protein [Paludibacteraceae bacterium]|nr:T9SS type A sorting domain-containing protein [Paludibacteraceae bacterium]MBN2787124.1 T9SS type A sorting domain-containing protein [Paludibacteraceae bacterium]